MGDNPRAEIILKRSEEICSCQEKRDVKKSYTAGARTLYKINAYFFTVCSFKIHTRTLGLESHLFPSHQFRASSAPDKSKAVSTMAKMHYPVFDTWDNVGKLLTYTL